MRRKDDTAKLVSVILKFWKILNIKNPLLHARLVDDDRRPFTSGDDERLKFLQSLAHSFMNRPGGRGASRVQSLTWETKDALFTTLMGTVELIRKLLTNNFRFILTAKFQSDDLEGEFGVYRQLSGGVYFVGVEQVLNSANVRTRQFINNLGQIDILTHKTQACCQTPITEHELDLVDQAVQSPQFTNNELFALYYICGYVARKENLGTSSIALSKESEFTSLVSRGFLVHPSEELFHLSSLLYSVFMTVKPECCNRFCVLASIVYDTFLIIILKILRTYFDVLETAFSKECADKKVNFLIILFTIQ